jgi:hypothetical protein
MSDLLKYAHAVSAILSLSYFLLYAILFRGFESNRSPHRSVIFKFHTSCVNKYGNTTHHLRFPPSFSNF